MSDVLTKEEQAQFEEMRRADAGADQLPPREPPPPREPEPPPPSPAPQDAEPAERAPPVAETLDEPFVEADALGRVDKRALDEARRSARQYREQLQRKEAEHASNMARLDERFRLLQGAVEQHQADQQRAAQPPPPPIPDFNTDPAGHWEARFRQQEHTTRQLAERQAQWEQEQRQRQEINALQQWGTAQEEEFARRTPDYTQATEYLRGARSRMLRAMGETDENRIQQQVLMDVAALALRSREMGLNFGHSLYELAKAHGYQPGAMGQRPLAYNEAASAQPPVGAAERLARGTDMATTLGSVGGAPRGAPAAAHIAAMSDDEFNRYYESVQKQGKDALRNLLGS